MEMVKLTNEKSINWSNLTNENESLLDDVELKILDVLASFDIISDEFILSRKETNETKLISLVVYLFDMDGRIRTDLNQLKKALKSCVKKADYETVFKHNHHLYLFCSGCY